MSLVVLVGSEVTHSKNLLDWMIPTMEERQLKARTIRSTRRPWKSKRH